MLLALLSGTLVDDAPASARLYEFADLEKALRGESHIRVLDVRSKADFNKDHIPGAVWVDEEAARKLASTPGGLTNREAWAAWIAPLSLERDTEVVVYGADRQLSAARVWWLLGYLGVEHVGLLNGNYDLWKKGGHSVTSDHVPLKPHHFDIHFQTQRHATRDDVLNGLRSDKTQVLDARSAEEFTGADVKSKRGGHVPQACHLEWKNVVDENGRFRDPETLRAMVNKSGIKPGSTVISHCQGGGRASVNAFVGATWTSRAQLLPRLVRLGQRRRHTGRG
jgi:thiosulfate/3-mercaptopyruvate sulfurtransferase